MTNSRQFPMASDGRTSSEKSIVRQDRRETREHNRTRMDDRVTRSTTILIRDPADPDRFVPHYNEPWLRLLARVFAFTLDRQLASGRHAESNRVLAARAECLVSPKMRGELAQNWRDLLEHAPRPHILRSSRVPLCRDRIVGAENDVRSMIHALESPLPTPARGVAMASWLLSDGTGPLYNRRCATGLQGALREATAQMDPMVSLDELA